MEGLFDMPIPALHKDGTGRRRPDLSIGLVVTLLGVAAGALFLSPAASAQDVDCADCHDGGEVVAGSVHGFLDCVDCHEGFDEVLHPEEADLASDCSICHEDEEVGFATGIHGQMEAKGELGGDHCATCHGEVHELVPSSDPLSPTNARNLPETCGHCHASSERGKALGLLLVQPLEAYSLSVHARAVAAGEEAASCNDCHDSHAVFPAFDPRSKVHHTREPQTCGACHDEIAEVYARSVHGRAVAHGIGDAPTCTDCHGEHRILEPKHEGSRVYASNIPKMVCGRCHGDLMLSEKFGIAEDKVPAYEDSYHGLATRAGSISVASCSSSHGIHDILPSTNPESHTHQTQLAETCGQCHPGAGTRFAIGEVHVLPTDADHPVIYWIRKVYLWLIVLTIGGMLLHNGLDLYRKMRVPPPRPALSDVPGRERLSAGFRWAHALLMSSFIVLVYTGFALKYPESWWVNPFSWFEWSLDLRGIIHRVAAVVMLLAGVLHVVHLAMDRRARRCILEMIPSGRDWKELKERVAYFLGRSPHPPKSPWVGYPEKMEYLAVIWGTVVMAVTGFILWFETAALKWMPNWVADAATVIHFYEAILASLAILVWHFYAVIFDPVVYPMDTAWLNGRSAPGREIEREPPTPAKKERKPQKGGFD